MLFAFSRLFDSNYRYELGGVPLTFQSDDIYKRLFPLEKPMSTTVTGAAFTIGNAPKRQYNPTSVERCTVCGMKRVFECQLMPHLINMLRADSKVKEKGSTVQTHEERQKEVDRLIKGFAGGVAAEEKTGMEWGTCLVFTCEGDCCIEKNDKGERWAAKACWIEEVVLVQWEL